MLRGSGIFWDLRKVQSYELYKKLFFRIPVGTFSDCYDRYLLRVEEMRQSVIIILQCLNLYNDGYVKKKDYKLVFPPKILLRTNMEAVINHYKLCVEGFNLKNNEVYVGIEAPKGEFGVYLVSNGTNKIYRCKFKTPGFVHLQGLGFLAKNHFIADIVAIIGTLDIVFGEVDR
jgi:NADH:ubiquinone oxidoreductase subunit D